MSVEEQLARLREQVPSATASTIDKMNRALEDERLRAVADRIESDRLHNRLDAKTAFVEVPAFERDVHDLEALAKVARYLMGESEHG